VQGERKRRDGNKIASPVVGLRQNLQRNYPKEQTIGTIEIPGFNVIGIQARTNNASEASADGIIGRQWHRFIDEGMVDKISGKSGSNLYGVYSEYASDHNGEYTFMVGAPVKAGVAAPAGMVLKQVPAGKYAVITTDKGPFPKVIPDSWLQIFKLDAEGKLKRTYQTDFEFYDERALDPQNGQVDIYIGV
jgi:predicted transcriptional regulator YdeE